MATAAALSLLPSEAAGDTSPSSDHARSPQLPSPERLLARVTHAPIGWFRAIHSSEARACRDPARFSAHWEFASGTRADTAKVMVCIPVHNEKVGIESCLCSLLGGVLPDVSDIHIVVVTNGSTDGSAAVIDNFISELGPVEHLSAPTNLDSGLEACVRRVALRGVTISHYVTATPGKARAQNLTNALARSWGYDFVVSIDSDGVIEPLTLAKMYGALKVKGAPLVFGSLRSDPNHGYASFICNLLQPYIRLSRNPERWNYPGNLMGWRTGWMQTIGGVPSCVIEDRAVAIATLIAGGIIESSPAIAWVRVPCCPFDAVKVRQRYAIGVRQLSAMLPQVEARTILNTMYPDVIPARPERARNLMRELGAGETVGKKVRRLVRFLCIEMILSSVEPVIGRADQTWQPIRSSK